MRWAFLIVTVVAATLAAGCVPAAQRRPWKQGLYLKASKPAWSKETGGLQCTLWAVYVEVKEEEMRRRFGKDGFPEGVPREKVAEMEKQHRMALKLPPGSVWYGKIETKRIAVAVTALHFSTDC